MTAPRGSISQRLTRDLSIWVGILWLTMSVGVTLYVQREIEEACDESLSVSASRLLELAAHEVDEVREHNGDAAPTVLNSLGGSAPQHMDLRSLTYQILTSSRAVLLRSADAPGVDMSPGASQGFSLTDRWRVYTLRHPTEPLLIHVADSVAHRNEERRDTWLWMLLPLLGAFPFIAWIIRRVTRHSLAPVEGLVAEIAKRGVTNMDPVAGKELPAEMQMIQESTNNLLVKLKEALEVERSLAANAAHELRTPLTSILTLNEVLLDRIYGPLTDRQETALHNIDTSARHLLALINDLLDLSKIEAGKLELHLEEVDVAAVCQASLFFVRERALKEHVEIHYECNCPDAQFVVDAKRMKQMLVNLLSNAVKFTPAGGHVTLRVTVDEAAHLIQFAVEDTGVGITPEGLAQLFQPFMQLDSILVRSHQGTGLGLALVKQLAEQHGGSVTATSRGSGLGSCFTITLPYRV